LFPHQPLILGIGFIDQVIVIVCGCLGNRWH
jgi:hypothetical protein